MPKSLVLLLLLASHLGAADLAGRIRQLLEPSPVARGSFWGIQIVNLKSGRILFQSNPHRFFVPASNTKLFTTALALMRLGPEYRFQTTVTTDRAADARGRISGSITLIGGGDPNLSGRAIPYRKDDTGSDPLQALEDLADQVARRGVREITGDVVGDDSAYVWAPYPAGWAVADVVNDDGPPVSALTINDNTFALTVNPGQVEGDAATVDVWPRVEYYQIDNRVRTGTRQPRKVYVARDAGSMQLHVWGTIPPGDKPDKQLLAIDDPAWYGARALFDALSRRGVVVRGHAVSKHLFADEVDDLKMGRPEIQVPALELARHTSAPLFEDLRVTGKVSQNLHAELVLRAVAKVRRHIGSREAGLEEMRAFLQEAGIAPSQYNLADGSGLSRLNLVTPAAIVQLLRYMYHSRQRQNWLALLPVGGEDGTLEKRFLGAAAGRIHAKTGTLSHVSALSGYAEAADGAVLAFSILVNNYNASASETRALIDKICNLMIQ